MEINFREVKDDLLKEWLDLREENGLAYLTEEDKKHTIDFDEISILYINNNHQKNKQDSSSKSCLFFSTNYRTTSQ